MALQLYRHYQAGHLALAGGALDQPAIYMRTMNTINDAVNSNSDD